MKHLSATLSVFAIAASTVAIITSTTAISESAGASKYTIPFPFPTSPADICEKATLDANGAPVGDTKFLPVRRKGGYIVGCRLLFTAEDASTLKPPFKATFTDAEGNTFSVTSEQLGSASMGAGAPPLPTGWSRVQNVEDYGGSPLGSGAP